MALTNGPNLGLLVNGNAGEGHYNELMRQWRGLDALVMPRLDGYLVNTPPASPADGDLYIIGAAPAGAWAGQGGKVTRWSSVASAWEFYAPKNGWMLQSNSARETYRYTGGAWEIFYQEGTWTPVLEGETTAGSHTYSSQTGVYKKVGTMVWCFGKMLLLSKDAAMAGNIRISGIPFNSKIPSPASLVCASWATDMPNISGRAGTGSPRVLLYKNATNAAESRVLDTDVSSGTLIFSSVTISI